jgi:hypothetical protein
LTVEGPISTVRGLDAGLWLASVRVLERAPGDSGAVGARSEEVALLSVLRHAMWREALWAALCVMALLLGLWVI